MLDGFNDVRTWAPDSLPRAVTGPQASEVVEHLSIVSATVEAHCDSSERPTHDRITVVYSTDGVILRTSEWHVVDRGEDVDTDAADLHHGTLAWDEVHDAAWDAFQATPKERAAWNSARATCWEAQLAERRADAYLAYVAACESEDRRRAGSEVRQ
jgi:inosine-uridine nucleoside N-ribohydrolase